jgi:hypothetical protein
MLEVKYKILKHQITCNLPAALAALAVLGFPLLVVQLVRYPPFGNLNTFAGYVAYNNNN